MVGNCTFISVQERVWGECPARVFDSPSVSLWKAIMTLMSREPSFYRDICISGSKNRLTTPSWCIPESKVTKTSGIPALIATGSTRGAWESWTEGWEVSTLVETPYPLSSLSIF